MKKKIKLNQIADIKRFAQIANRYPFDIIVGADKYLVSGKSILGLFSLDLANDTWVQTDEGIDAGEFLTEIQEFIVPKN